MLTVKTGGHRDLERYYSLFEIDFERGELLPKLSVHRALSRGDQELLLFQDAESGLVLAYALVMQRSLYGYVLLKYFGVLPWYRGHGIGLEAMRSINRRYADRQGIVAELTVFDDEEGATLKTLRRFFARFGYVEAESDVHIRGEKVHVLVKPLQGTEEIGPYAHRILLDFYSRVLTPGGVQRMVELRPAPEEA